tara:strand:- start:1284 stop:1577 length:294 start_codon:yes stop_codon:yes gene_type:complete
MLSAPEGYIRRKSSTIPFGYEVDEETKGFLKPVDIQIKALDNITELVHNKSISLAEGTELLEFQTNRTLSRMGLKKLVDKKYEERLGNKSKSLLDRS